LLEGVVRKNVEWFWVGKFMNILLFTAVEKERIRLLTSIEVGGVNKEEMLRILNPSVQTKRPQIDQIDHKSDFRMYFFTEKFIGQH
jgi:hypothetical protein